MGQDLEVKPRSEQVVDDGPRLLDRQEESVQRENAGGERGDEQEDPARRCGDASNDASDLRQPSQDGFSCTQDCSSPGTLEISVDSVDPQAYRQTPDQAH